MSIFLMSSSCPYFSIPMSIQSYVHKDLLISGIPSSKSYHKKERKKPTNRILIICIWFRLALNFNNLQIPEDGHMEFVTEID